MKASLSSSDLAAYISRQLNRFFPDPTPVSSLRVRQLLPEAMARLGVCISASPGKYFVAQGRPYFDHLHSDQYAMLLYLLGRVAGEDGGRRGVTLATKLYLLNKALHSIDVYYEVALPEVFLFAHPLGTVLGRATYGNHLIVMQGCTVGNIESRYPSFGDHVVLSSGASVLGNTVVEGGVCVGAGSLLVNARIPRDCTVVGRGNDLRVLPNRPWRWSDYFKT